jgi:hypothetical protein
MPDNSIQNIESTVKNLVKANKLTKAITHLLEHYKKVEDDPRHDKSILLSSDLIDNEKKYSSLLITKKEYDDRLGEIKLDILNIFDPITPKRKEEDRFGERIIQIAVILIILFLIIGIIAAVYTQGFDPIEKALQASLFVIGVSMVAFGLVYLVKKYILV